MRAGSVSSESGRASQFALALLFLAAASAAAQDAGPGADPRARLDAALERNNEAVRRFEAGDVEGALGLFRAAAALAPDDATIRANTGRCLLAAGDAQRDLGRHVQAARDYHEAGTLLEADVEPAVREGLALYEGLRLRDAAAVLERALARWPDEPRAHDVLGRALYRLGDNARAIACWERALALRPDDAPLRALLEQVRREEAVEAGLVLDLGAAHFAVKYDGREDVALGRLVVAVLEDAHRDVGALLGRYPPGEVAVVVYPRGTFAATLGAHSWVAGLYDGKIRVPADGLDGASEAEVRRVLTHEFAHALVRAVGGPAVPAWLHEGLAQVAEGRTRDDARRLLARGRVPSAAALAHTFAGEPDEDRARALYAAACDLVHGLLAQGGAPLLAEVLDRLGRDEDLDDALRAAYGSGFEGLHAAWVATLPR